MARRVIVDVDVGTDDYLALLILLQAEKQGKLKIEAVNCCMGNTTIHNVCKNVARLLHLVGRTDIPVYKGAEKQLILPQHKIPGYHKEDGFGDLKHESEPDISFISNTPSAIAMNGIVTKYPKEVSLIFLGPLTNLALAIKLYANFVANVKDLWIMGGNCSAVGNVTSAAEFNFYVDPEAVHIVLECMTCPIFILPWETCLTPKIPLEWRKKVLAKTTPVLELYNAAEESITHVNEEHWLPCDAFVAFAFVDPEKNIVKQSLHHALIELHSSHTRGQIVLDHLKNKQPNVSIIETINVEAFKDVILEIGNNN